jgi:hypothetical protein
MDMRATIDIAVEKYRDPRPASRHVLDRLRFIPRNDCDAPQELLRRSMPKGDVDQHIRAKI